MTKILVVDDDQDLRENLVEVLNRAEFEPTEAENGEQALARLSEATFDLMLLDSVMPGMGGMEILPQVKRTYPKMKVVMLTAFSTVDGAVEAMRKGADDYLTKPFKINELLMTIRRSLEEAKFGACDDVLNMDDMFKCLSNATRRQALFLLKAEGKLRFMDIARKLEIEDHTKVNFHLKVLKEANLLEQDNRKNYRLAPHGEKVIACLRGMSSS